MKRIFLLFLVLAFLRISIYAQHSFPPTHWCNTTEGWKTKGCRALYGMKFEEKEKVIAIPHRGSWGLPGVPENCMTAIDSAYTQGYMFVEVDVILTADKKLFLCHDQQTNRMTSLPPTFSADGNLFDNGTFVRNLSWFSPTLNKVPDIQAVNYPSFPAINTAYYKDRFNNITNYLTNTFEDVCDYMKSHDIIVALDIKTGSMKDLVTKKEYLEAISIALRIAEEKNVLSKLILKPGSSGQVTVDEIQAYLEPRQQWDTFRNRINVILINIVGGSFPMATDKKYLDAWYNLPSLIAVEQIYKKASDPLLTPNPNFGNKSIVQYTKDRGFRTGVFHPIPTNIYGAPGGRGNYFNPNNYGEIQDLRGNLEFLFSLPQNSAPGIIVTDRPDVDRSFLKLFNLESKYTLRTNDF